MQILFNYYDKMFIAIKIEWRETIKHGFIDLLFDNKYFFVSRKVAAPNSPNTGRPDFPGLAFLGSR